MGYHRQVLEVLLIEITAINFKECISYAIDAHTQHAKNEKDTIRFWDGETPYFIHPAWCAMTILTETKLSKKIRYIGFKALLYHDILEDTKCSLPKDTEAEVKEIVEEMTFNGFAEEVVELWSKKDITKLLKLYDKVSNLLDGAWMDQEKLTLYIKHTRKLADFVFEKYGDLNIVKMANSLTS